MSERCQNCTPNRVAICDAMFSVAKWCIEDMSDVTIDFEKGNHSPWIEGPVENQMAARHELRTTLVDSLREAFDCSLTEVQIDQRLCEVKEG